MTLPYSQTSGTSCIGLLRLPGRDQRLQLMAASSGVARRLIEREVIGPALPCRQVVEPACSQPGRQRCGFVGRDEVPDLIVAGTAEALQQCFVFQVRIQRVVGSCG